VLAVELRLGEIRRRGPQDLVGPPQLFDLTLQLADAFGDVYLTL
jgi:hypothetical protein